MKKKLNLFGLKELDSLELKETNGGFIHILGVALGVYTGVCAIGYGSGYLYGKIENYFNE
jgi:lactobin A/cerein 7B family class IIb bacteriocin